jgi:hypothetical protein
MSFKISPTFDCENPYHVGITEAATNSTEIQILKNPIENMLSINFFKEKGYEICIYNLLGEKLIETKTQNNSTLMIDLSYLNSGIYFATFVSKYGETITKKIIKK